MNILYLCDEYPPGQHGGIGTSVRLLAREMVKQGHHVVAAGLYAPGYGGEDKFDDQGVKVYRFRRRRDSKWFAEGQSLIFRIGNRILKDAGVIEWDIKRSLTAYKEKLEALIIEHRIDIIEMPDYNDYIRFCRSFVPFPALSVPVVIKMNGSITYFTREAGKPVPAHVFKMEQHVLNLAAAIASASSYTAQKSAAYFSYPHKIEVLHNGIHTDMPVSNIPKNPQQVIFTGALAHKKGIYQLAKAWNIVTRDKPGAQLLVLGKGDQRKVASYLSVAAKNTVKFMGHINTQQLYRHLSASSISIFPSYSEAFALAPLEAMACGTTVINSNRTSGPELITDQVNGLLIDPDNIEQMASAILYLLNEPAICAKLAKAGNESVKANFEIGKIADQNIRFYSRILENNKLNVDSI